MASSGIDWALPLANQAICCHGVQLLGRFKGGYTWVNIPFELGRQDNACVQNQISLAKVQCSHKGTQE